MDGFGDASKGECGTDGLSVGAGAYQYVEPSHIAPYLSIANHCLEGAQQDGVRDTRFDAGASRLLRRSL